MSHPITLVLCKKIRNGVDDLTQTKS